MERKDVFNLSVSTGRYTDFNSAIVKKAETNQSAYVCVANVHMLIESRLSSSFASAVNGADIVTPDGKPLTWAIKLLHGVSQDRVAGMDILPELLAIAERRKIKTFFYGGSEILLDKSKLFFQKKYPGLKADFYSPPFRKLSVGEEAEVVKKINASLAQIVFVVLGCPKQEKWMASMKGKVNAVMIGVGGALPVMINEKKRAPKWMQDMGMEWFYRLCQEPKRLFRRYLITNALFLFLLARAFIKIKWLKSSTA